MRYELCYQEVISILNNIRKNKILVLSLNSKKSKYIILITLLFVLILCFFASLLLGYVHTSFNDLINTYMNNGKATANIVIRNSRMQRSLTALFIGANLSLAGLLMQTLTKNPIAAPSLLGVNSGAAFFMCVAYSYLPGFNQNSSILFSFLGGALAVIFVYTLSGGIRGSVKTFDLMLAGAAVSAFFMSFTQIVLYKDQKAMEDIIFWLTGSVADRNMNTLIHIIPYCVAAWIICFLIHKKLNVFSLGEEIAKGLGLNTEFLKLLMMFLIVVLAGTSVAVAGPISLVGLIIPHFVRYLVGSEFKWTILYSLVIGAIFLLMSDIASRFIIYPKEIPVGVLTALIGTPFFIYIARKAVNK